MQFDLFITDPPYNVEYEGKTKDQLSIQNDNMSTEEFESFLSKCFSLADNFLKNGASFYIFHASRTQSTFEKALPDSWTIRQQLIWNKNTFTLGRQDYQWKHEPCIYGWKEGATHNWYADRKQTTVLDFDKPTKNEEHPTMKPIELIAYLIRNSTRKDNLVLDLFGGSGSTLLACEQIERKCFTMELDPKYCDVIIKRWENLTGQKVVKVV